VTPPSPPLLHELWETALGRLSTKVSPQNFDMWLRPIEYVRGDHAAEPASEHATDPELLQLRAPNSYVRLWFESNYLEAIVEEIRTVSGIPIRVEFTAENLPDAARPIVTIAATPEPVPALAAPPSRTASVVPEPAPPAPLPTLRLASLNPRYTFDTFVAGPSNQLAFAASHAAGSAYPPKYNPVFLCGGVGLGKTHLLHAIGHTQLALHPDVRIVYISSERFMNEYVNAIRAGKMQEFRTRYREGVDVLLVDDVQFLAGKDGTQEEFFHTFNALHDNHKQIVLTADRKPHEIADIADRLRTRFAWGLLADIEPPELEVRLAILRKKAAVESIPLPDDVAMFIASSIKSNVRELEGALIRLAAYASLSKRVIDLPFAHETLGGALARPREHITVETVIKLVAAYYGVKAADLKSQRRHRSIASPRAVAMYLARQHTKDSYPDLGRSFGGKHHTTVISAVEKIAERLADDPGLRGEIHSIEASLLR
jgi:chromosomal replication initiator protein